MILTKKPVEYPSLTSLLLGPSSPGHCLVVAVLELDLPVVQVHDPLVAADQAQPALVTAYQLLFLSLTPPTLSFNIMTSPAVCGAS